MCSLPQTSLTPLGYNKWNAPNVFMVGHAVTLSLSHSVFPLFASLFLGIQTSMAIPVDPYRLQLSVFR